MRVQPLLPISPFEARTMRSPGAARWACSAASSPAPPEPRTSTSHSRSDPTRGGLAVRQLPARVRLLAEAAQERRRQAGVRLHERLVDLGRVLREEGAAERVPLDEQGAEPLALEHPHRLRDAQLLLPVDGPDARHGLA